MSEDALHRLDRMRAAATIAHEVIFDLHRELVSLERADATTRQLLEEASRVAAIEMPELCRGIEELRARLAEHEVLGDTEAGEILAALDVALGAVLPNLGRLRKRQDEIARELRRVLDES